jgi:hypothetical protein
VKIADTDDVGREEWESRKSWKSFTAALAIGTADLAKNAEKFKKQDDADYQIISVVAARKLGILPIAFQADREFVPTRQPVKEETAEEVETKE